MGGHRNFEGVIVVGVVVIEVDWEELEERRIRREMLTHRGEGKGRVFAQ